MSYIYDESFDTSISCILVWIKEGEEIIVHHRLTYIQWTSSRAKNLYHAEDY